MRNTGQLILEVTIVIVQLLSVCMAVGFVRCVTGDPPQLDAGQNFHLYDHVSSGPARPLMPKKLEPIGAALAAALENATVVASATTAAAASGYPICPEAVSDDAVPRWTLEDDSSGIGGLRDEQVCTYCCLPSVYHLGVPECLQSMPS